MAASSLDQIAAALPGQFLPFYKATQTTEGAGTWHSLWKAAGNPAAGATPPAYTAGSGYSPTKATAGAFPFNNPVGGLISQLAKISACSSVAGTLILADRLWTCSGLTTAAATTLNITTPGTIPSRDENGAALGKGVELWGEVYTAPGATGATWTVSYTDQDGNTGNTATYTHPANAETVGQMFPYQLASGDSGVRAVASFTTSISSGTAGDIGISLIRRIVEVPLTLANIPTLLDWASAGLPRIIDDSCLFFMVMCSTTTSGNISGLGNLIQT